MINKRILQRRSKMLDSLLGVTVTLIYQNNPDNPIKGILKKDSNYSVGHFPINLRGITKLDIVSKILNYNPDYITDKKYESPKNKNYERNGFKGGNIKVRRYK
jgi:hypothetical protein